MSAAFDIDETFLSQYVAPAVIIPAIIESFSAATITAMETAFDGFFTDYWNINTAVNEGLDNWGEILGVSRYLTLGDSGSYWGFADSANDYAPFGSAPFYSGGSLTTTYELSDDAYRQLLLAKARANISGPSIQALNQLAQDIFGPGAMYVNDLGDMAMQYVFNIVPTPVQLAIAEQSGVLPHPTGVAVAIVQNLLNVSISPPSVSIVQNSDSITTGNIVVSVSGGETPYTWEWSCSNEAITVSSPTNTGTTSTVTCAASGLTAPQTVSGTLSCLVTDNAGRTATPTCALSLTDATPVTVSATPSSLSATGAASITTGTVTATISGGFPPYSYVDGWEFSAGGDYLVPTETSALTTAVQSDGLPPSTTTTGSLQFTVTDSVGQQASLATAIAVSVTRVSLLSGSISPSSGYSILTASASPITTGEITASGEGGQTPYSFVATWQPGTGSGLDINTPDTDETTVSSAAALSPGQTLSGTLVYTITDDYSQTAAPTAPIVIERATLPTASVSPTSATSSGIGTTQTTNSVTLTGANGKPPYGYSWSATISGGATVDPTAGTSQTTAFEVSGMTEGNTYTGTGTGTVTDALGQTAQADPSISVDCEVPIYGGTLVAGYAASGDDTFTGYYPSESIGSLSPLVDPYGNTINALAYLTAYPPGSALLVLEFGTADLSTSYFTQLVINGTAYPISSAARYTGSGYTYWEWTVENPFTDGGTYPITIDYP